MGGRVEVVRSDLSKRDLRLVVAAVEGLADRVFFSSGGLSALPSAVGQSGLGSDRTQVTSEVAALAETFVNHLQEFLCRHLPPSGWNVVLGGRVGFAIRSRHKSGVVLRTTTGESDAPISCRKTCVLLVYRAPSAIELPPSLLLEKEKRLLQLPTPPKAESFPHDEKREEDSTNPNEKKSVQSNSYTLQKSVSQKHLTLRQLKVSPIKNLSVTNQSVPSPSVPDSARCPTAVADWGFLSLAPATQRRKILEAFSRASDQYSSNKSDNIQSLAQLLKEELVLMSGPLWHVLVGREDIHIRTGGLPIVSLSFDWSIPSSPTSGTLRIVAFQLCGEQPATPFWDFVLKSAPYVATGLLCLLWMLKSRLCEDDGRSLSSFQSVIAKRLCGHQGLEVTTALLFCALVVVAISKIVRKIV